MCSQLFLNFLRSPLTTGQSEDYTTECLLDYDYIHYDNRLIIVALNRQKKLNTDPKTIQQIKFIGQTKQQQ